MAIDGDHTAVTYTVRVNSGGCKFAVNSSSGEVYVTDSQAINYERVTECTVAIRATDAGTPALFSQATVSVYLVDINDHSPTFQFPTYAGTVAESAADLTAVATMFADDNNSGENAAIVYAIVAGNDGAVFSVNETTGEVFVSGQLDYETVQSYTLRVNASDKGLPSRTGSCLVQVAVTDVNDNTPVFDAATYTASATEDIAFGTEIIVVGASDADSTSNAGIRFSFVGSVPLFSINALDGVVTSKSTIDRETAGVHVLTIMVKDTDSPSRSNTTTLTITVLDVNDNRACICGCTV